MISTLLETAGTGRISTLHEAAPACTPPRNPSISLLSPIWTPAQVQGKPRGVWSSYPGFPDEH
ncbi:MAG: hypothetical protein ACLPUX_09145 [Syntrophobacteraceae bacterium]